MGLSIYPTPSASSVGLPAGAIALVTSGTNYVNKATGGFYWSTTLAAGSYIVHAQNDTKGPLDYVITSHEADIYNYTDYTLLGPKKITLSTTGTITFSNGFRNVNGSGGNLAWNRNLIFRHPFSNNFQSNSHMFKYRNTTTIIAWAGRSTGGVYVQRYDFANIKFVDSAHNINLVGGSYPQIGFVGHQGSRYFVAYNANTLRYSTDAITWATSTVTGIGGYITDIVYGSHNGRYVLCTNEESSEIASGQNLMSSADDGASWSTRATQSARYHAVGYGNNTYIVVGESNKIATSTDSVTWTTRTPATNHNWGAVEYFNGAFYIFATSGDWAEASSHTTATVNRSTDGITWTTVPIYASSTEAANGGLCFPTIRRRYVQNSEDPCRQYVWQYGGSLYMSTQGTDDRTWVTTNGTNWSEIINTGYPNIIHTSIGQLSAYWTNREGSRGFLGASEVSPSTYYVYSSY